MHVWAEKRRKDGSSPTVMTENAAKRLRYNLCTGLSVTQGWSGCNEAALGTFWSVNNVFA